MNLNQTEKENDNKIENEIKHNKDNNFEEKKYLITKENINFIDQIKEYSKNSYNKEKESNKRYFNEKIFETPSELIEFVIKNSKTKTKTQTKTQTNAKTKSKQNQNQN